ncbi:hypothetical protein [Paenibacillus ferrarius]|uniref:hypothetical protein n=1 Tax=Paenibacillus ferrarius TaxID=1469647 RepID=UPI003D2DCE98
MKNRNGAAQYALLSAELRNQTVKTYEELNWVTGVSSPWIDSYQVSDSVKAEDGSVSYKVTFQMKTSTGSAGEGTVKVTVGPKDGKWLVTGLSYKDGSNELNGLVVVPGA